MASDRAYALLADVLTLPDDERRLIADRINAELSPTGDDGWVVDSDISDEWKREIEKRCADIEVGTAEYIDADDVRRGLDEAVRVYQARPKR